MKIANFTTIDSEYGPFIVNRHCAYQAEVLIKTGKPHIEAELAKILAIVNTLGEGAVVVDGGANIGLVAIPVATLLSQRGGQLIAYEPQRMMAYALCGAVALNDLENIDVRNQALGSVSKTVAGESPNYAIPQDFGMYSLANSTKPEIHQEPNQELNQGAEAGKAASTQIAIEVVPLDSLNLARLDFFKVDVEGMEIAVLEGARSTIQAYNPWCWVEYWQVGIDDIKAQFSGLDYRFYRMDNLNLLCAPSERLESAPLNINAAEV